MAEKFAQYVHPEDRMAKGASVVQSMKQLANEVNRMPVREQEAAYEAFNAQTVVMSGSALLIHSRSAEDLRTSMRRWRTSRST